MNKSHVLAFLSMLAFPLPVSAQERIQDHSLSIEESLRQPNNPGTLDRLPRDNYGQYFSRQNTTGSGSPYGTRGYSGRGYGGYGARSIGPLGSGGYNSQYNQNAYASYATGSNRFMDSWCDPNFKPLATRGNMAACLEGKRQQACEQFTQLPADAQAALDDAMHCLYSGDDEGYATTASSCAETDSRRMQLLRRYWQDEAIAGALLFMPEDTLNGCSQGGRW